MIQLCEHCIKSNDLRPGTQVYLPKRHRIDRKFVVSLRKKGRAISDIASQLDLTPRRVYQILATA